MKQRIIILPVDHWRRSGTGLAEFTLCAPTRRALMDAREHLRYWPFVKEFRDEAYLRIRVTVFIGRGYTRKQWQRYSQRGMELMTLCVKQHQAYFREWSDELSHFDPKYTPSEYLRPDNLLQPMSNFIDEMKL